MTSKAPKTYRAPALAKGLEILELLANSDEPLAQAEIARRSGRTVNELFRMLSELESMGYVRRDYIGAYSLTLKLFSLANLEQGLSRFVRLATGPMRDYCQNSGQECHLSMLEDGKLIVLASYNGNQSVCLRVRTGSIHHPLKTASGRLLMAQLPPEDLQWHLDRMKEHFGGPKVSLSKAQSLLAGIVGQDEQQARDESLEGVIDYAIHVTKDFVPFHATIASCWLHGGDNAPNRDHLVKELSIAAQHVRDLM